MLVGTYKVVFQVDFICVHLATTHKSDLMIELIDPIFEEPIFSSQLYSITNNTVNINESSQFDMYILFDYTTNKFLRKQCQLILNMQASSSKVINTRLAGKLKPNFADILNNPDNIYLKEKKHLLSNSSVKGQIEMKISVISKEEIKKEEEEIMADKLVDQFVTLSPTKRGKVQVRSLSHKGHEKKQLTPQKPKRFQPLNSPSKKQLVTPNLPPRPNRASQKFIRKVQQQKPSLITKQSQKPQIQSIEQKKITELNTLLEEQRKRSQLIKQQLEHLKKNLQPLEEYSKQIQKLTKEKQEWQIRQKQLLQQIESVDPQQAEKIYMQYCQAKEQNMTIKYQLADCQTQLQAIKSNLGKAKEQIDSYIQENSLLKKQKQILQKKLQGGKIQQKNGTIHRQVNKQSTNNKEKEQIKQLKNKVATFEQIIKEKDQIIVNLSKKQNSYNNNAQAQILKLQEQLSLKIKEINENKAKIKTYQKQIQTLQKSINYEANKNLAEQNARLKANQLQRIQYNNATLSKIKYEYQSQLKILKAQQKKNEQHFKKEIHNKQLKIKLLQDSENKLLAKQYEVKAIIKDFQIEYSRMLKMIEQKDRSEQQHLQKIKKYEELTNQLQLRIMDSQNRQSYMNQLEDNLIKYRQRIQELQAIMIQNRDTVPYLKFNNQERSNSNNLHIENLMLTFNPKENKEQLIKRLKRQNENLKLQQQQDKNKIRILEEQVYNTRNRNFNSPSKTKNFQHNNRSVNTANSQNLKQLEPFIKKLIHNLQDRTKRQRTMEQVIQILNGQKKILEKQQQQYKDKLLIQQKARDLSMKFQQLKLYIVQNKEISRARNQLLSQLKKSESEVNQLVKLSETLAEEAMNSQEEQQ